MRTYCPGGKIDLATFSCKGEPFKEVTLCRFRPCGDRVLVKLPVTDDSYEAAIPDKICEGVWRLTVRTSCGCHSTMVYINCDRVAFEHKRDVTNLRPVGKVCCDKPQVAPATPADPVAPTPAAPTPAAPTPAAPTPAAPTPAAPTPAAPTPAAPTPQPPATAQPSPQPTPGNAGGTP